MVKLIRVDGCWNCPFYEQMEGRTTIWHTCRYNQRTVKNEYYDSLFDFCELEEV